MDDLFNAAKEIFKPHPMSDNGRKPYIVNTKKWYQNKLVRERIVNFTDDELYMKTFLGERNGILWFVDVKYPIKTEESLS
jgi:hypothetical protein